jgi:hypothetical protein
MKKSIKALTITGIVITDIIAICVIIAASYIISFRKEYRTSKNAIDEIINEFQYRKIIALGERHTRVNEELFIADNIQALYNAGVRYIFVEGGPPLDGKYLFLMWYPWSNSGWRFEEEALYQAIINLNNTLPSDDVIKIVSTEKIPPDNMTSRAQQWNYRDSSSAETIIEIMDTTSDETKAIIWYGAAHTLTHPWKNYYDAMFSEQFDWIPFGYLLKEHYGSDYSSYYFITDHYNDHIISPKYLLDEPKLVVLKNMPLTNIPFLKYPLTILLFRLGGYEGWHDGYIIESETIQGTFYQYNPTNENLSFLFKFVEDYALEYKPDINYIPFEPDNKIILGINYLKVFFGNDFDYASPKTSYMQYELHGQFMTSLYYLKLYFGDKFDYTFWKTEQSKSLLSALAKLKDYAFTNKAPSEYIQTNYSREVLRLYHKYMILSLVEDYNMQNISGKNIQESYLQKARELLSEDLWSLYWLGFAATEKEQWEKGLDFFQELFAEDIAYSMESLPLAYQKAALCAEKLGNHMLAEEYNRIANTLYNDYNIIVDKNRTSSVGYYNGPWLVSDM